MILYLAGGFHFSNSVKSEKSLADHLLTKYNKYQRLGTFFYTKDADNIIQVMEEVDENQRIIPNN